jgi:23S rRNA-/tRNA-specific pseudouridylate synthase
LCFALSKAASGRISGSFESRRTRKTYLALVHGHIALGTHLYDCSIGDDPNDTRRYKQLPGGPANPVCIPGAAD